ncbi:MAG TPA: oligopeptide/dipeptide ABC transporter ATP-binding protein [Spirochaetia bacterium]|nr:oligopeptide/dipeptide ABC transporter ATP-binding protein [Spirochaetia bacterium]
MSGKILELRGLTKHFPMSRGRILKAVEAIDLDVYEGETFGLVGESGCGKSTLGRTIKGIYEPTAGTIRFQGQDTASMTRPEQKVYRRNLQIIFQDPYSSLNPRMTVRELIGEGLEIHRLGNRERQKRRVFETLEMVGLNPEHVTRFAHEFSGGQRQRLAIARALAVEPRFIICDEPISALDVSIQGQIVNLMKDLQRKLGLTYLFIAHDLSMVKYISDRVGVMYLGRLVEVAEKNELFRNPQHPYTQALLSSIPIPDPRIERQRKEIPIEGEIPSPMMRIDGCSFRARCPFAAPRCASMEYTLKDIGNQHYVMCTKFP